MRARPLILGSAGVFLALAPAFTSPAAAQRSAQQRPRSEIPATSARGVSRADISYSVTLPLGGPYRWWIVPEFPRVGRRRITATTEDGQSQEWTGTRGNTADPWVLTGFENVNVKIERMDGGKWVECPVVVRVRPMPSPDPTRRLSGTCRGEEFATEVSVTPSRQ
jgi:hypothetical protein